MLEKIKKEVVSYKNKVLKIKVNNIRNKSEYVICSIKEVYDRFFLVTCIDGINRSFNYSDVLTGNIEIEVKMC